MFVTRCFHREKTMASIHPLKAIAIVLATLALTFTSSAAKAVSLIRDPDIEHALNRAAAPVLAAAGLGGNVQVLVVNDRSLNAFVIDNNHIFIHLGMLLRMDTPEMFQAVVAHEAAHITNGHISRRITNMGAAQTAAGLGLALAAAAAAATGNANAGVGIALGTTATAERRFLAHTRAEEVAADQTGVRYMSRAGVDPQGAVDVHEIFRGQEALNTSRQDPYMRSHPLTRDRIRTMKSYAAAHADKAKPTDPDVAYWYARARAKLAAFTLSPGWTLNRLGESPTQDIRLMREAAARHRLSQFNAALTAINSAIKLRPEDAFYYELKGQILLENRRFNDAVSAYRKSAALAPRNALCLASLGRALLAADRPREALDALEKSRNRDFRNGLMLRDLGAAYARTGNNGMAALSAAERYALQGRLKDAGVLAKRASGLLPTGSRGWRRAEDILRQAERAEKK
ncbi:M48 family metalloprotease [uncultured Shimia sp.]|uniref:M48 family metalloprotease n=2 Tax=Roseobacteraceae TaxID=2854170 RepID=UPI002605E3A8|nr:M48 family metalloprotease [uncultured Shimia sp.]